MLIKGSNIPLSPLIVQDGDEDWAPRTLTDRQYRQSYQTLAQTLEAFRKRFYKEYLNLLETKRKLRNNYNEWKPKVGEVVILKNEHHRFNWPLVRITEVYPDEDEIIRTIKVYDGQQFLLRDPSLLIPLEISSDNDNERVELAEVVIPNNSSESVEREELAEIIIPETVEPSVTNTKPKRKAAIRQREFMKSILAEL